MIISFSGPQSSGKTTLLNHLKKHNKHIDFEPEITRLIKRNYNLPINENGSALTQYMIMSQHVANIYKKRKKQHVILDRCALDGIVYTKWLVERRGLGLHNFTTAQVIYESIKDSYDIIFYTRPDDVSLTDDGERSIDKCFRDQIITIFNEFKQRHNNIVELTGSVKDRLKQIQLTLTGLDIKI